MSKVTIRNKERIQQLIDGTTENVYALESFIWKNTPQGHAYWARKKTEGINKYTREGGRYVASQGYVVPGCWDGILTEDDKAYLKSISRDKSKFKDKFLTVKKHKEYVDYVDGLETESDQESKVL